MAQVWQEMAVALTSGCPDQRQGPCPLALPEEGVLRNLLTQVMTQIWLMSQVMAQVRASHGTRSSQAHRARRGCIGDVEAAV